MKNWQFCMVMAAVYLSPLSADWVSVVIAGLFIVCGAVAMLKDGAA